MVLGNKIDLLEGREVNTDEAMQFTNKYKFVY